MKIDTFKTVARSGALQAVFVVECEGGFYVRFTYGIAPCEDGLLETARGGARVFSSLDTVHGLLRDAGYRGSWVLMEMP